MLTLHQIAANDYRRQPGPIFRYLLQISVCYHRFHRDVLLDPSSFRLIPGLAKLSRKVKNTANIRLSANVFGWYLN